MSEKCVCVCVCVWEREREREGEGSKGGREPCPRGGLLQSLCGYLINKVIT